MSLLLALAAFGLAPPVTELEYLNALLAKDGLPPWSQEEFNRQRAYQARSAREHETNRLKGAGFAPAELIRKEGRALVRASYSEPRLFVRMPGVTLEKGRDGRVTVTLSSDGRAARGSKEVPAGQWQALQALEQATFAPDPPPPPAPWLSWKRGDPLPAAPRSVCHGWGATLERVSPEHAEKAEAHECKAGALAKARLAYAEKLAEIAVRAFPRCTGKPDRFQALAECFGTFDPATTDNP